MKECAIKCLESNKKCKNKICPLWINYSKELNCSLISIEVNDKMTLEQVGERLGLTHSYVKKIQDKAVKKLKKNFRDL